jgi:hypothetical protein
MGMVERFKEYTVALEDAYHDDNWSRLVSYFAENATYRSYYGADLEVTGRDLRRSRVLRPKVRFPSCRILRRTARGAR